MSPVRRVCRHSVRDRREFATTQTSDDGEDMNSTIMGLRTAGTVFAIVCLGHLLRVVTGVEVLIGGNHLPVWMNGVACVIAGGLSVWMWKLSTLSADTIAHRPEP